MMNDLTVAVFAKDSSGDCVLLFSKTGVKELFLYFAGVISGFFVLVILAVLLYITSARLVELGRINIDQKYFDKVTDEDVQSLGPKFRFEKSKAALEAGLFGHSGNDEIAGFLNFIKIEEALMLNFVPNGMPLNDYRRVSSKFGMRNHPILRKLRMHKGIDFSVAVGTPVHGTAGGVVEVADAWDNSSYGKHVVIRHGLGFSSLYAHMQDIEVKVGDYIEKGALLGRSGSSGRSSSPHLHYEIKYLEKALEPKNFIEWSSSNYGVIFSKENDVPWVSLIKQVSMWRDVASADSWREVSL